jgi:hypothetical protein
MEDKGRCRFPYSTAVYVHRKTSDAGWLGLFADETAIEIMQADGAGNRSSVYLEPTEFYAVLKQAFDERKKELEDAKAID